MLSEAASNLKFIQSKIQAINAAIVEASEKGCPKGDRNDLEKFEKAIRLLTSELADWIPLKILFSLALAPLLLNLLGEILF